MSDTAAKELTPKARARRPVLVGTSVELLDGNEWTFSALPLGPAGDLLDAQMHELVDLEAEQQVIEARQEAEFARDTEEILGADAEGAARANHKTHQERLRAIERKIRAAQAHFVFLALRLHYDVEEEEVANLADLRLFRRVYSIASGAPELDELREAVDAMKGGSGN